MTTATPTRHPIPPEVMLSSWVALWDDLIGGLQDDTPQVEPEQPQQPPKQAEPPPDVRAG